MYHPAGLYRVNNSIHMLVNFASFSFTEEAGKPEFTSLWKVCSVKNDAKLSVACIRIERIDICQVLNNFSVQCALRVWPL